MILETERLTLREFTIHDVDFILRQLNTPGWLQFIGDRNVHNHDDARNYLTNGPLASYTNHGFGLWLVSLKSTDTPVGMCGFLKRAELDAPDIGFALLPEHEGHGYAREMVTAALDYGKRKFKIERVLAIANDDNIRSLRLLSVLGFKPEGRIRLANDNADLVLLGIGRDHSVKKEISYVTKKFFDVFTNHQGKQPTLTELYNLFIPQGMIVRNTTGEPEVYSVTEFIIPRKKLLTDGTLTDFQEEEIHGRTEVYGNMAQHFCLYRKSGVMNGRPFTTLGSKSIQFVKVQDQWKISAVVWDDEKK